MPGICPRCQKNVYFAEEKMALGKSFHKMCFACGKTKKSLTCLLILFHYIFNGLFHVTNPVTINMQPTAKRCWTARMRPSTTMSYFAGRVTARNSDLKVTVTAVAVLEF